MKKIKDDHRYLVVTYRNWPNRTVDWMITKAVGYKYESGSGCGFGGRDISFRFGRNSTLRRAVDRLMKLKAKLPPGYRRLRIDAYRLEDED